MKKGKYLDKITDEEREELQLRREEAGVPELKTFTLEIEQLLEERAVLLILLMKEPDIRIPMNAVTHQIYYMIQRTTRRVITVSAS